MKKKQGIVVAINLLFLLSISACGIKNQTATYTLRQDDENVTIQNIYKKDTLLSQTVTTIIKYKNMGVKTKTKAKKLLDPSKKLYTNKKGVNYSIVFNEEEAVETIEIDLENLSQEDAKTLPLISLPVESLDSASEKANEEKLLNLGFEKKNKK